MKAINKIVTHSGPFHADDILAVALLQAHHSGSLEVERTREEDKLKAAHGTEGCVLVDVGRKYDPDNGLFDHHFKGSPVRENGTPYASAGLVYEYILGMGVRRDLFNDKWLREVVEKVDATDNGQKVPGWRLSLIIHKCNPVQGQTAADFDHRFHILTNIVRNALESATAEWEFVDMIESHDQVSDWVHEYDTEVANSEFRVRHAMRRASEVLVMNQFEPGLINVAHEAKEETKYVVFPSPTDGFMVQQIPTEKMGFVGRLPLPEAWAGKNGGELDELTGIPGCVFVHPGRFIGGNKTLDGAVAMAALAIRIQN